MVNHYKAPAIFQDIEHQLQENILHQFLHYSFFEIFTKLKSIFYPFKIIYRQFFIFIIIFHVFAISFCISINRRILLKPPTTDPPTHQPLCIYPPTHRPLTHQPTDWLSSPCVKTEDQILNMFCNLQSFKTFIIS